MGYQKKKEWLQSCAALLYQNQEQEAYQMINKRIPEINDMLQTFVKLAMEQPEGEEITSFALQTMKEFLEMYQRKDNLGLADLTYYQLVEIADILESQAENIEMK